MKTGSINLASSLIIPKEGKFKPNGNKFSFELFSSDLGAASITVTLKGTLSGTRFGTLANESGDITETLTSGVALVRTFDADPEMELRLDCGTGTGTVNYVITE